MAEKKRGNPNIAQHGFKKGDPRINRTGLQKKLPVLQLLMAELLGVKDGEDMTKSEMAVIVKAMIARAKDKKFGDTATKEILDRAFGKVKQETVIDLSAPLPTMRVEIVKPDESE